MRTSQSVQTILAALLVVGGGCSVSTPATPGETGGSAAGSGGTKVSSSGGATGGQSGSGGVVGTGGSSTPDPGTGGRVGSGGSSTGKGGSSGMGGRIGTGGDVGGGGDGGGQPGSGGSTRVGGATGRDAGRDLPPVAIDGGLGGTAGGSGGTTSPGGAGGQSEGCGSSNTTSPCSKSGTTCSLTVNSKARAYYVQLPSGYSSSKPTPVVFQFHPWGGSAEQALTMYSMSKNFPEAILVTPQGLPAGGSSPGWANTNGEDIAFTKAMVADIEGKYCVDKARIFSTGFSYGGMMSFAIACEMADVFRAIGPMAGSLYSDTGCKGTGPHIAMFGTHGTSDSVVPIADGRAARDKILKQNHCGTETKAVDPSPCVQYQGCDEGYPTIWCEWSGDHGMPSFGNAAIATFFKQF